MQSLAGLLRRKPPDAPPRGAAAYDSAYDSAQNIGRIVNIKIHPRKCNQNCQRKRCLPNFPFTRKIECGHRRKRCRRVSRRKRIPGRPWNQQVDRSIHVARSWPYKNIFQNDVAQNRIQNHGTITTKPIFLVLGIKIKTSASITHAIEKFPRLVTNRIASSKKGVLKC